MLNGTFLSASEGSRHLVLLVFRFAPGQLKLVLLYSVRCGCCNISLPSRRALVVFRIFKIGNKNDAQYFAGIVFGAKSKFLVEFLYYMFDSLFKEKNSYRVGIFPL